MGLSDVSSRNPSAADRIPSVPATLLAALRVSTGLGPASGSDGGIEATPETASSWSEALTLACRNAGLSVRELQFGADRACDLARPHEPLVTWSEGAGWKTVLSGDGSHAQISPAPADRSSRVSARELAEILGDEDESSPRTWLLVRAGMGASWSSGGEPPTPISRLLAIIRSDRSDVLAIILYAAFIGLLSLAIPIAVQQLVNTVAYGGLVQPVVVVAVMLLIGLSFAASLSAFQAYLAEILQRRIFIRACVELAERLPRLRADAFGPHHGPERVNRFFDLITLQKTGARLLLEGSAVLLQTFAGLLILSFYHPLMLGLSVLLVSAMAFILWVLGRGGPRSAIGESTAKYALAEWFEELARHRAAFRSRSGRAHAAARADALAASWVEARRAHYRLVLRQFVAALGLQAVVNTLVLALGGFLVVTGELTLGQLVASELIVATVVAGFARLGKQLESFYDLLAAADKVGSLLDLPLEREAGRAPNDGGPGAALEARRILDPLLAGGSSEPTTLHIEAGERVAFVGRIDGRQSALLDLLCGAREPASGFVTCDGEDLRELSLERLREQVFCLREPEIFSGSVLENVRAGRTATSPDDVSRALECVGLLDEIRALPNGVRTRLATEGAPFSRSQITRLMVARAIAARPRVLALDCALAVLDRNEREVVLDALFDPQAGWTLLVVSAHDDVIARCDRMIPMPGRPALRGEPREGSPIPFPEALA